MIFQAPKRSGQVTAIDAGNKVRLQRGKRDVVVPVEEMPEVTWQTLHRRKRALGQGNKLNQVDIAHFESCLAGVKKKAQISRRRAFSNAMRLFLDVVRNQPVVLFGAEFSEVAPGALGDVAQKCALGSRQLKIFRMRRAV